MEKYRQSHIRNNLVLRSLIIQAVRRFFENSNYLEVSTPTRIPAPAPEAYIDAQPAGDWFLQTSPELCMKQLLAAGYPRIFQICSCFRQEERGKQHLPEFAMLEWYAADTDYREMMGVCEDLIRSVAIAVGYGHTLHYQGCRVSLDAPWDRISVKAAFDRFAPISLAKALADDVFDEVMTEAIEPFLGIDKPLFLYDYPAQRAALARLKPDAPAYGERFELYIAGIEICNAFSELADAAEQRQRFTAEAEIRSKAKKAPYPMPDKFLNMLPDMPEASGNALGLDRLVMVFADAATIDEIVAFVPEDL